MDESKSIAALAGIETSSNIQGKDLVETFENPDYKLRDFAFSVSQNGKKRGDAFLIRSEKWSFIQYGENSEDGMELYDMQIDPKQYTNLSKLPAYSTVVERMKKTVTHKLKEVRENDL